MTITIILVVFILSIVIFHICKRLMVFCHQYKSLPQGNIANFFIGDASIFVKAYLGFYDIPLYAVVFKFFNELLAEHRNKEIGLFWLGWYPVVAVIHPKYIEKLLTSSEAIEKAPEYRYLHAWLGTGLLTSGGHKWKERRRMLSPSFHFRILNDFVPIINEQSAVMIQNLTKEASNTEIDIFEFIPYVALDIISETAMGVNIKSQTNPKTSYVKAVMLQSEVVFSRFFNPLMPDWFFYRTEAGKKHRKSIEILHEFTMQVINEKIKTRSQSGNSWKQDEEEVLNSGQKDNLYLTNRKRLAFMDLLIDAYLDQSEESIGHGKIDIEGIREEVDTFMFEGFDTTAAAVSWIIFLLGHNQECQQLVYEEIEQLLGNGDLTSHIDQKCLSSFKYLEACVKEGLRLFPSVPMIGRKLNSDMEFGPHRVPKNTTTVVYLYGLHRCPVMFPEPEKFLPERFLGDSTQQQRHPFAYLPFSAGHRNCIGQRFASMEIKIMLIYLIRNFHIQSTVPLDKVSICIELITRPKSKLGVRLTPRNQSI